MPKLQRSVRAKRIAASPREVGSAGVSPSFTIVSRSLAETERFGRSMGKVLQGGEVFALYGEVGTGKTALVRGIAAGLGAEPRDVGSPTFVLIHEYRGRLPFAHADLYRLESFEPVAQLGLDDYLDGRTVVAVEWAERAGNELPPDRVDIRTAHQSATERTLAVSATGPRSRKALARMFRGPSPSQLTRSR